MAEKEKKSQEGLTAKKEEDFSEWYQQLIIKSELADYSSVSGCIVFRPLSYSIWEKVQQTIDKEFKKIGVKNVYFPIFIPESLLAREQTHVKGFTPEVAWVTQAGDTKLSERLAVRPTSEAIMYDSYSKWVRSWRDLPLKLNQWNNVIRWEFKHPIPFLRTREFLWNEGHHAYSNKKDLEKDREKITKIYQDFLKEYMALPSILGKKTDKEKFAGAEATYSLELYLPNGKAIQGPDYHDDGQNFSKAYGIKFLDEAGKEQFAYQSTYAITTRMLGIMFAIHSDNKGLVLPPKLAQNQVVIIPVMFEKNKNILEKAKEISRILSKYNPIVDERTEVTPGWKYNEWELKGIPIRIEIGPKDLEKKQVVLVRRDTGEKIQVRINDIKKELDKKLQEIHDYLFKKAQKLLFDNIVESGNLKETLKNIKNKKIVLTPLKNSKEVEDILKDKTDGAKTLNIPFKQPPIRNKKCIISGKQADYWVYVGKSY